MKLVLDSNVLISAFASRGLCAEIFEVCLSEHIIILSEHIIVEVEEALIKKIHVPLSIVKNIIAYLRDTVEIVGSEKLSKSICKDKNDDIIIGTALAGEVTLIITGDDDLLSLRKYHNIKIITPREFWRIARQEQK